MEISEEDFNYYLELHYFILKQKYLYYYGVGYGFKPIPDEDYDSIELEYKRICEQIGLEPEASKMVGFDLKNPISPYISALAMRDSNEELYDKIKHAIFEFRQL